MVAPHGGVVLAFLAIQRRDQHLWRDGMHVVAAIHRRHRNVVEIARLPCLKCSRLKGHSIGSDKLAPERCLAMPAVEVLSVSSGIESVEGDLAVGALDFAIDIDRGITDDITTRTLTNYAPSIWMRHGHPLANKEKTTLEDILKYPFVQYYLLISKRVSARNNARFDRTLAELGLKREKALVTNQLLTAMETVCDTDCLMVATQKSRVMEREEHRIVSKPFPEELPHEESIKLVLLQHQRTSGSPIHQWIVDRIFGVMERHDGEVS